MSVKSFLKKYPHLQPIPDSTKVRCALTGHELPSKLDVLQQYVQGKKYKTAKETKEYDFGNYRPHLVPHKKLSGCFYCQLTRRIISKTPAAIDRHVTGNRYQKAFSQWKAKESPINASTSDTESQESEVLKDDDETDIESDDERDDCSDLYPPVLLRQETEFELESEVSEESTQVIQNGEHEKNGRSSNTARAAGQSTSSRKRKAHIQRKKPKHTKLTQQKDGSRK